MTTQINNTARNLEIRCVNHNTYSKGCISVDLNDKIKYQIEYARGEMMKKVSLNNNIKDTFYRLSSKQIYSTESVVVETNTIGDKLREVHYGDNVIVYRGAQAIYG